MESATIKQVRKPSMTTSPSEWEESYRPLPYLFFGLLIVWTLLVFVWTINTWTKRRWQTSNLQWVLTAVPTLKSLVLSLSFVFWYSCLNLNTCSFWVAFGVFVSRIFFETACFIAFLLIAHGYCIMHEQLAVTDRRSIAGLASLLYLTLTGYKAAVPQFAVLVILIYGVLLYVIMAHVARNLTTLREQLQHIQEEGVHMMHSAIYTKYTMFKKFQRSMLMMVVAEILMHARAEGMANDYWIRLLVREFAEISIFFYIGWTFRSREMTPFFTVIPTTHTQGQRMLPPIYSVEMNEKQFNNLDSKEWHIGVPTSISKSGGHGNKPMLVIVQNPGMSNFSFTDDQPDPEGAFNAPSINFHPQKTTSSAPPPPPPFPLAHIHQIHHSPELSSSLPEHQGPQLRARSNNSGDLVVSTAPPPNESGEVKDTNTNTTGGNKTPDNNNNNNIIINDLPSDYANSNSNSNSKNEVVVDVKGLTSYASSFLPFERACGDSRLLHSRSTSALNSQGFSSPHPSSIV